MVTTNFKAFSSFVAKGDPYILDDIQDGKLFEKLVEEYPDFMEDPLSLLLGVAIDGFCPFGKHGGAKSAFGRKKTYTITPITAMIYNLPPEMRTKKGLIHIVGLIAGPSKSDLHIYLEPFVDELLFYWEQGLHIQYQAPNPLSFNIAKSPKPTTKPINTLIQIMLVHLIADYRGMADVLTMVQSPSPCGCFYCHIVGFTIAQSKCIYTAFWRWLSMPNPRRNAASISMNPPITLITTRPIGPDGKRKSVTTSQRTPSSFSVSTPPPAPRKVEELRPWISIGTRRESPDQMQIRERAQSNVLWRLPYYWNLGPIWLSSYDPMHTTAGVIQDAFLSISTNGGSRRQPAIMEYDKEYNKSKILYSLSDTQTAAIEARLIKIKLCSSGVVRHSGIHTPFKNPGALKMHDWILLASPYGKYALFNMIPEDAEKALYSMFDASSLAWRKVITSHEIQVIKETMIEALHQFEQHFPSSEMDIKCHNWIHLAEKVHLTGPMQTASMFPFERLYHYLGNSIGNSNYPESSMLKNFVRLQQAILYQMRLGAEALQAGELHDVDSPTESTSSNNASVSSEFSDFFTRPDYSRDQSGRQIVCPIGDYTTVHLNNEMRIQVHKWYLTTNDVYGDLWILFVDEEYYCTLKPKAKAKFKYDDVLRLNSKDLCQLLTSFESWKPKRPLTKEEELIDRRIHPYQEYKSGQVNVAGCIFKISKTMGIVPVSKGKGKAASTNGCTIWESLKASDSESVFMAVRSCDSNQTYFGVIRSVLRIPHPLVATPHSKRGNYDNVVYADWFNSPATSSSPLSMHPCLNVPVINRSFLSTKSLGTGNLWSCVNIVPIHLTLMPNIVKGGTTCFAKRAKANGNKELVVLSRDSHLLELAHPSWGPNAHAGANLSGKHFRILRRTNLNSNIMEEQNRDEEDKRNEQLKVDKNIDAWVREMLKEANGERR